MASVLLIKIKNLTKCYGVNKPVSGQVDAARKARNVKGSVVFYILTERKNVYWKAASA